MHLCVVVDPVGSVKAAGSAAESKLLTASRCAAFSQETPRLLLGLRASRRVEFPSANDE